MAMTLTEILSAEPSPERWKALCALLTPLKGEALQGALSQCRGPLAAWPSSVRRLNMTLRSDPGVSWLASIFTGRVDPRLSLVGWASLEHHQDFDSEALYMGDYRHLYPLAKAFARYLDPSFEVSDEVVEKEHEYTAAYGCGGGFDFEKRGDGVRGLSWYDNVTEHSSSDSSDGSWSPYGMAGEYKLKVGRYERGSGHYSFSLSGDAPKVFILSYAWGVLVRQRQMATTASIAAALTEGEQACQQL